MDIYIIHIIVLDPRKAITLIKKAVFKNFKTIS